MAFFFEVLLGGLLAGVLYSLVALGFVLIFKASGVFNFAQGAMVLFAALTLVRLMERMPFWAAFAVSCLVMIGLAYVIERVVLRRLVNQEGIILFMATLGIAFFLEGFGQTIWGSDIYTLDLGIPKDPSFILDSIFDGGLLVDKLDVFAAVVASALVIMLALFFQKTKVGLALRAVADDHQAAQSIGVPLNHIWLVVWSAAGIVALVAGMVWLVPRAFVTVSWVGAAVTYYLMNLIVRSPKYRWMGHLTLLLTALYVIVIGIFQLAPAYRIASFLVLGTVLLVVSLIFTQVRSRRKGAAAGAED